jgi:sugar phosphate permease
VTQTAATLGGADHAPRRWVILAIGWAAQTATCSFLYGAVSLVPALRRADHLSLSHAELVVAAPSAGLLLTLIAWGALADRFGERLVISIGLVSAGLLLLASASVAGLAGRGALLFAAGAAGASVNAASGRVVMGWFGPRERGLAMGVRQTAQPIGVGIGALILPALAGRTDVSRALVFPAVLCLAVAGLVLVLVVDPPRPERGTEVRSPSPYRESTLWRLHGASTLLVVPQFAISAFVLEYLVSERHWGAIAAGRLVFAAQVAGAAGRIATGWWSDRVGSRLRPMRQLAVGSALVMGLVALSDALHSWLVIAAFVLGAVITVADNGLGFISTAELAGTAWSGRALGAQNTAQNIAAALTPPLLGALVGATGYSWAFAAVMIFPALAVPLTPVQRAAAAGVP